MSKPVALTWVDMDNKTCTEEVYLLADEDQLYSTEGNPLVLITDKGKEEGTVSRIAGEFVAFEDEDGVFLIRPERIIHIEDLRQEE